MSPFEACDKPNVQSGVQSGGLPTDCQPCDEVPGAVPLRPRDLPLLSRLAPARGGHYRTASPRSQRRSGCIPAEPYPPRKCCQCSETLAGRVLLGRLPELRIIEGSGFAHRDQDRQETVGDPAQRAAVAVSFGPQLRIVRATPSIALTAGAGSVIHRVPQPLIATLPHAHHAPFTAFARDRRHPE